MRGEYGDAPLGGDYLIIGHESLGRVVSSPDGGLRAGQLVVAIVRRPDPVPCVNCAAGESDMCLNGLYTGRGIKGAHGFLAEEYTEDPIHGISCPFPKASPRWLFCSSRSALSRRRSSRSPAPSRADLERAEDLKVVVDAQR